MSKDSSFNRDQKKEEERGVAPDFAGSSGKGMLATEKIETLENYSGLTPISFSVNVSNRIMDRENNELIRTEMNSGSVSSYGVRTSSLSTLHPFDEIHSINKKSVFLIDGFSDNEGLGTLKNSSGLTPLNYDSEPPMDAGKRINSPQRTLRTQSSGLTNFALKESELNDR